MLVKQTIKEKQSSMQPKKTKSLKVLQKGFLRIPRYIIALILNPDPQMAGLGKVYLYLLSKAFFRNRTITHNKKVFTCQRGEFVDSQHRVSRELGMSRPVFERYLRLLLQQELIDIEVEKRGTLFRIRDYQRLCGDLPSDKMEEELDQSFFEAERSFGGRCLFQ